MKLLLCRQCGDLVCLRSDRIRQCECGNVRGRYGQDRFTIEVAFEDVGDARVVGISNDFLKEGDVPFDAPSYANTLFAKRKSHIILVFPFTTGDVRKLEEPE